MTMKSKFDVDVSCDVAGEDEGNGDSVSSFLADFLKLNPNIVATGF